MRTWIAALSLLALSIPAAAGSPADDVGLVRRMTEAINERDFDALDTLVAADVKRHSAATPGVVVTNLEEFKAFLHQDLSSVPDARMEIEQIFACGDRVAARIVYRGTQSGPMGPFPPSGKQMEIPFLSILRIEDGKIAEIWAEWDNLAALTQLGHFPPPEPAAAVPAAEDSEEQRMAVARVWFDEVINQRNLDAIPTAYAADYRHHGTGGQEIQGLDKVRGFAASILAASKDRHAVVEQQLVDGNLVVTRFTSRGTRTGAWQGIPPNGKPWTTEGIVISRIEHGRIVEDWEVTTSSGL